MVDAADPGPRGLPCEFLRLRGIPHVRSDCFSLGEEGADVVFLQNPYDLGRPPGYTVADLTRAGHRICYIPYAIELGGTDEDICHQFNLPLQQMAWAVFARSEEHRDLFAEHCAAGNRHVVVTGHPKFDVLGRLDTAAPDPDLIAFARGRPLVLWTPHFDVRFNGTRFGGGYSTFRHWRHFIPAEFERRQDLALVIRPHPAFYQAMVERGILSQGELDTFFSRCAAAGNIRIDRSPSYESVLAAADALVSDLSSMMIEYGISGRPVCYLHNPAGPMHHLDYELDFDYVRQHCTWATTERQIAAFLDAVASATDRSSDARIAELRRRMGVRPEGVGPGIKEAVEERLAARAAQAR
jgi:hypothetical protein